MSQANQPHIIAFPSASPAAPSVLDRLARLEQRYDGAISAPLRAWALSGAPPVSTTLPAPVPATIDHRAICVAAFAQAKQIMGRIRLDRARRRGMTNRADARGCDWRIKENRAAARRMLAMWRVHRDAELAVSYAVAAE